VVSGLSLTWVGCYLEDWVDEMAEARQSLSLVGQAEQGFTTVKCARACRKYAFMALQEGSRCTCGHRSPSEPRARQASGEDEHRRGSRPGPCGEVCAGEEGLLPIRYCGASAHQEGAYAAVYHLEGHYRGFIGGEAVKLPHNELEDLSPKATTDEDTLWPRKVREDVLKAISYAPVPLKGMHQLPNDDFMSRNTSKLWGFGGRGDLHLIKSLGANGVRLYGLDPALDHRAFLDEAWGLGLDVIAGLSDYPYTQMGGSCVSTNFNCYTQVREQYGAVLKTGFLLSGGKVYHPALRAVILMNEPDLKFFPLDVPAHFCRALVSAFDAVLDAEKEAGVTGPAPNFTATFSFGVCRACKVIPVRPGLGQMEALRRAMRNPSLVGYTPKNNLWKAYRRRFVNSVNTANPARSFHDLFMKDYDMSFQGFPLFIGEFHAPGQKNQTSDLEEIVHMAADPNSLLSGISFFEFQVRYDKGGKEMSFGMFGLGDEEVDRFSSFGGAPYTAWCLDPVELPPPQACKTSVPGRRYKEGPGDGPPVNTWIGNNRDGFFPVVMGNPPIFTAGGNADFAATCAQKCEASLRCSKWTFWFTRQNIGGHCYFFLDSATVRDGEVKEDIGGECVPGTGHFSVPQAVTAAFGGHGVNPRRLCSKAGKSIKVDTRLRVLHA